MIRLRWRVPLADAATNLHESNSAASRLVAALYWALALSAGFSGALMSRLNGQLSKDTGSPVTAALISFSVATLVLLPAVVFSRRGRAGFLRLWTGETRWFWWIGGVAGAFVVAAAAAAVPLVGVSLVTVAALGGRVLGGLILDHMGAGPAGRQKITRFRLAGAAIAIAGVAVGVSSDHVSLVDLGLLVLVAASGFMGSWQQAINGHLGRLSRAPDVGALVSFVFGTASLGILVGILSTVQDTGLRHLPSQWWLYGGGILSAYAIVAAVTSVAVLGVLKLVLMTLVGQLVGATLLDIYVPVPGVRIGIPAFAGMALSFLGVLAITRDRGRRKPTAVDRGHGGEVVLSDPKIRL